MSFLDQVAVLILTYNEEPNIGRTLAALRRFDEIVVLDSGSTDATRTIVYSFSNARCHVRPFDSHAEQWSHGLTACGVERPWILALDADYVLSAEIIEHIAALSPDADICGYRAGFRYCVFGRGLRGTLYPTSVVLFRRDRAKYIQHGHTQRVIVDGRVSELVGRIDHDDRKPLSRWLSSQQGYARLEAEHLLSTPRAALRMSDRIRLMGWPAPILVFFYTLVARGLLFDGWSGWLYVLQRTLAETMIAAEIVDRQLQQGVVLNSPSSNTPHFNPSIGD
jgi:glycosyltransferase involved in cell wall biosynthesis